MDERISAERRDFLEAMAARKPISPDRVRNSAIDYYKLHVYGSRGVPHTFMDINAAASMGTIAPELKLVRIENIAEPLEKKGASPEELSDALGKDNPESRALVETFLDLWNTHDDIRRNPVSFASRKDHLLDEISDPDWPNRLRNRLGLAHHNPTDGPIPVALMIYEVEEVLKQTATMSDLTNPFCAPTALDGEPYEYFFPTPKELNFGCPVSLAVINSNDELIAEMVHSRLTYKREHIAKVGHISSPLPGAEPKEMRDAHLWALRIEVEREDFGEEL